MLIDKTQLPQRKGQQMAFFDRHSLFLKTSPVGNWPDRLNARYQAIIEDNRGALKDATVLDLASHDGRWSFAALDAGASHVTGIEVRPELVAAAAENMTALGVAADHYEFVQADMFESRELFQRPYDVVLCLGVFYHTTRHIELIELINRTGAATVILDTMLATQPGCLTVLRAERADNPANGLDETGTRNNAILVGHPTASAVDLMLGHFGYDVQRCDWEALITKLGLEPQRNKPHSAANPVGDYASGLRGTFVARRPPAKKG